MKRNSTTLVSVSLAAAATFVLSACGQSVTPAGESDSAEARTSETRTVENCGRSVSVAGDAQRVVSMMPGTTDLLVRLGVGDRVVAEAQSGDTPLNSALDPDVVEVLSVDSPPSREVLLNVAPDLVVSPTSYEFTAQQGFASIDQLSEAGAAAYIATAGCFDRRKTAEVTDILDDIEKLSVLLDTEEQGAELSNRVTAEIEEIEAAVGDRDKPTVTQLFIEGTTISAIGAGLEYDIIQKAGGDNVFHPDSPEFSDFIAAVISPEELIARNPDVIVISVRGDAHEQAVRAFLTDRFADVAAVRDDRIVAVSSNAVMPGTWGNIEVLRQLAEAFHPEAF
ncbi:ABC transporter substrate-binding protein [Hoyosella rhizosphaerae]|uniref:Iron transporter n=1 Tax=Hoyosella rhizosphaerae TaxID=1755582 RepID=A0A916U097_9ACTN|nr:ABC transporter substrate-binding protein [Hoyosella rhizosphaerae]MBN4927200.1 ABC transporter substrate-binding protein [Hoyosella rhizosphaerae]GGC53212.1 iron transporter [Hoyosella rhizosphaerae]